MGSVFWSAFIVWVWAGFWIGQLSFGPTGNGYSRSNRVLTFISVLLLWPIMLPFINPLIRRGNKIQENTKS